MLIDFCLILEPSGSKKTLKNKLFLMIFAFFACSFLRPILDRFWVDFGLQNRPKIGPRRVLKGDQNHVSFLMPSWTPKIRFLGQHGSNMARFWAPRWPQVGPKIGPKTDSKADFVSESVFAPILHRFCTDFGPILGRFWDDFETIVGCFWCIFDV